MSALFDLSGKAALVTGGATGLGNAIARGLAAAGASVVLASRNRDHVAAAVRALDAIGQGHRGAHLDVADPASIESVFQDIRSSEGKLDILVNSAGITQKKDPLELSTAEWDLVLRTNLTGTFLCCQAAGRIMKPQRSGSIINIASIASLVGLSEVTAYGASKAAVAQLTQSLANDWARHGIRVNAIVPGVFPTDLNRPLLEGTERGRWLLAHTPMGRFGDAHEIAGAAIYLASDAASYTTGALLAVDGGFLARGVGP